MKLILKTAVLLLILTGFISSLHADEGMWLPLHIKRLNYVDMQKQGLQLTPEEIYDVNNSSLKDAIVRLGRGSCTAEMISPEGLMLTNHHCSFGYIQQLSSMESDFLTNGFWAATHKDELPAPGLSASFLIRIEDVTAKVLAVISDTMSETQRNISIATLSDSLEEVAVEDTHFSASVRSFYSGNEFYLFVYETFNDVRLVGTPPESIGKFGGDTDNWMWPRHTGDFSLLRIYTAPDGKPAEYSEDNIPYKPRHYLPISLDGVKESDYAMIMGYPGSTDRFLTSYGIKLAVDKEQPSTVKIREKRLSIIKEGMNSSPKVRLMYASKYARTSNYYKYYKGQIRGLKRLKVYDKKKLEEQEFTQWIAKDESRKKKYGSVITDFEEGYREMDKYKLVQVYTNEAFFGVEINMLAVRCFRLYGALRQADSGDDAVVNAAKRLLSGADGYFKDYHKPIDQKVFAALLKMYYEDIPKEFQPPAFEYVQKKFKGDFDAYAEWVFEKSIFSDKQKYVAFLQDPNKKILDKDPVFKLVQEFIGIVQATAMPHLQSADAKLEVTNRSFIAGLREMNPEKNYYPDANSTMRLTYGNVLDYYPMDAVYYNYYTTLAGVIEKEDPNNSEFIVPEKLKELYLKKDYGPYGENGVMKINFITNNDITGGNSGSPVINAKGELIGCAFDGNWESMSGDISFETEIQRCINVDIRYILFIIDKFAGAKHIVDEMKLVKTEPKKELAPAN